MNRPHWREPGDPDLYAAVARVWALGRRTFVRRFPPGIHKHRTIEALNEQTEAWAAANFEAFWAARRNPFDTR